MPRLSAIICTYNPRRDYLDRTLESLRLQDLPLDEWEFILVDNASPEPLAKSVDLSWHPNGRIVVESKQGLTPARLRGLTESKSPIIVYIDDDNILRPDYLRQVLAIFAEHPEMGAIGGKSIAEFEREPEPWFKDTGCQLACRDHGDQVQIGSWKGVPREQRHYPKCAPVGAGMALRREAMEYYANDLANNSLRQGLDRTGNSLASGGDNDIVMTVLEKGWQVGYFPQLYLRHLIPARRLTKEYLAKLTYESSRTWVLVLDAHKVCPWPPVPRWSVPLRNLRSWLKFRAWKDAGAYIRWRGACGQFQGRSEIRN